MTHVFSGATDADEAVFCCRAVCIYRIARTSQSANPAFTHAVLYPEYASVPCGPSEFGHHSVDSSPTELSLKQGQQWWAFPADPASIDTG